MRILMATAEFPPFPGGVSAVAFEQARGLARLGHEVVVETLHFPAHGTPPPDEGYTSRRNDCRARAIARLVPLTRGLLTTARQFRPDIIHCPQYRGYGLPVRVVAGYMRLPYTLYIHGRDLQTEQAHPLRRRIARNVAGGAAALFSNSQNTARIATGLCPGLKRPIQPVTPGVDAQRFSGVEVAARGEDVRSSWLAEYRHRGVLAGDAEPVVMLTLARIARQKGIDRVLAAMAQLGKERPDLPMVYVVAGDGPQRSEFQQLAEALGIAPRVLWTGPVSYAETPPFFRAADLFVQPSQPDGQFLESFGIVFLEAAAAGLPAIASNGGGVPEAVIDGETALLVPMDDTPAIVKAISQLACDRELRARMAAAGPPHAEAHSWVRHCSLMEKGLAEACANNRAS